MDDDKPIRASEAARRLGIRTRDLLRLTYDRQIPFVVIDGVAHYRSADLGHHWGYGGKGATGGSRWNKHHPARDRPGFCSDGASSQTGWQPGTDLIPRAGRVGPSEPLRLFNGTTSANVLALATFLRVVDRCGCWGHAYHLDGSIGSHGDSGAAVVDIDGLLVGHYLGRLAGMAVVQDVSYQAGELAKTGTTIP